MFSSVKKSVDLAPKKLVLVLVGLEFLKKQYKSEEECVSVFQSQYKQLYGVNLEEQELLGELQDRFCFSAGKSYSNELQEVRVTPYPSDKKAPVLVYYLYSFTDRPKRV